MRAMRFLSSMLLLLGGSIFVVSCSEHDVESPVVLPEDDSPSIPTLSIESVSRCWGNSIEEVKTLNADYKLVSQTENALIFKIDEGTILLSYRFLNNCLSAAAVISTEQSESSIIVSWVDGMRSIGVIDGDHVYYDATKQDFVFLCKGEQCVSIGFAPTGSDYYGDNNPPGVFTKDATDVYSYSAVIHAQVSTSDGSTLIDKGVIYSTSYDNLLIDGQRVSVTESSNNYSILIEDLTPETTYYYAAYCYVDQYGDYGDILSFTTKPSPTGNHNGHEWVDLGLPSGRLWATTNIGGQKEYDDGYCLAWGEVREQTTITKYVWNSYSYWNNGSIKSIGSDISGNSSYDAARYNWGGEWRMPSDSDFTELINNTQKSYLSIEGHPGILFTGRNGQSLFLPAAGYCSSSTWRGYGTCGYYWASTCCDSHHAFMLDFYLSGESISSCRVESNYSTSNAGCEKYFGQSVRAIMTR